MSSYPCASSMLAGIAQALEQTLAETAQVEIANIIGCSQSCISRRHADLALWSAADLIRLASRRSDLANAVVHALSGGAQQPGSPTLAVPDLIAEIRADSRITDQAAAAIEDGRISDREAMELLKAIRDRRRQEDERLIPDLQSVAQGAK